MNVAGVIDGYKKEYEQMLKDSTENFESFFNELKLKISILTSDLEVSVAEISKEIYILNKQLEKTISDNANSSKQLSHLTNSDAGAIGMFSDSKNMYIHKLVATLLLVFTMVGYVLYFHKNKLISFGFNTTAVKNKAAGLVNNINNGVNNIKNNLNPQSSLSVLKKAKPNLFS